MTMMKTMKQPLAIALLSLLAALFVAATPAVAQDAADDAMTDEAAEAFGPLLDRYSLLRRSLQAQNGLAERDKPLLESLRSDIDTFAEEHPDHTPALAIITQLSIWLDDHDAVFEGFDRLVTLDPDNVQLAVDWEAYFTQLADDAMLERVQDRLQVLRPDDPGLAKRRAETFKARGNYERVAELLSGVELDPLDDVRVIQLLATAQAAMHQFEAAAATLRTIPESTLETDPRLRVEIEGEIEFWDQGAALWEAEQETRAAEASADDLPRAEIVTSKGSIIVELFENEAPNTIANFVKLATDDFWPGTRFHRVEPGLLVQGGDPFSRPGEPRLAGTGNPGYYIEDEHHFDYSRNHFTGSLAMAKRTAADSAGCQFYISMRPTPWLNSKHTVFGRVLDGMDVVRSIAVDDEIIDVKILRKRDHDYNPDTLPLDVVGEEQAGNDTSDDEQAGVDDNGDG